MTKKERRNPDLLQASRKRRIAAGAGLEVQELNRLLKMHRQMADVMKKMGGMGKKGLLRGGLGALFGKGAPPDAAGDAGGRRRARRAAARLACRPASPGSAARNDPDAHHRAAGAARRREADGLRGRSPPSSPRERAAYEDGPHAAPGRLEGVRRRRRRLGAARLRLALGDRAAPRRLPRRGRHLPASPLIPSREIGWILCPRPRAAASPREAARRCATGPTRRSAWTTLVSYIDPRQRPLDPPRRAARRRLDPRRRTRATTPCLVYRHPGPEARA